MTQFWTFVPVSPSSSVCIVPACLSSPTSILPCRNQHRLVLHGHALYEGKCKVRRLWRLGLKMCQLRVPLKFSVLSRPGPRAQSISCLPHCASGLPSLLPLPLPWLLPRRVTILLCSSYTCHSPLTGDSKVLPSAYVPPLAFLFAMDVVKMKVVQN